MIYCTRHMDFNLRIRSKMNARMFHMHETSGRIHTMPLPPDFINELKPHFTGDIRNDLASRILYSTDASIYQIEPQGVIIPKTQDDFQAAVEFAAQYRIPILPRGAGTSLAGQAIGDALILDCSRWLDHILAINPEE